MTTQDAMTGCKPCALCLRERDRTELAVDHVNGLDVCGHHREQQLAIVARRFRKTLRAAKLGGIRSAALFRDSGIQLRRKAPRYNCRWFQWRESDDVIWGTGCGDAFCFSGDDPEFDHNYRFCPTCGGRITFDRPEEP